MMTSTQNNLGPVRIWLYGLVLLTMVMVLVGGATRLTDSGLSITKWQPITGFLPPLGLADWQANFKLYQTTDEFKLQNSSMTLEQFKVIYWWEFGHRVLGRVIGLAVLLPMIWFWWRGAFNAPTTRWLKPASLGLFALVCFQGLIGWWMVKSGLVKRVDVSQLRLAVHLVTACIFLAAIVWTVRSTVRHTARSEPQVFWQGGALVVLVLLQIFCGGLVAGLDAGMAYNTWPDMNGNWVPDGVMAISPAWKNLTDNAATVQFVHRLVAYLLLAAVILHALHLNRRAPSTPHQRRAWILTLLVLAQAMIGIITLVSQVPVSWALIHQLGGVIVLISATAHWRGLRPRQEFAFHTRPSALSPEHGSL